MRKFLPLILIAAIVVVSGCTGGESSSSTNGVIISAFSIDPTEAYGDEEVYFTMDIENVGGAIATDVKASLIGLDQWGYTSTKDKGPFILEAPEAGIEGGYADLEWTLIAPASQTDITYPLDAQVSFVYRTHSETLVRVASRAWIYSLPEKQREEEIDKVGEVKHSPEQGPIHTTIKLRKGVPYTERGELRVSLIIQNVGSGSPSFDGKVNTVHIDSISGIVCDDYGKDGGKDDDVPLTRAATKTLSCRITEATIGTETWKNVRIDIDLRYRYAVRSSYQVTVIGEPSGTNGGTGGDSDDGGGTGDGNCGECKYTESRTCDVHGCSGSGTFIRTVDGVCGGAPCDFNVNCVWKDGCTWSDDCNTCS